MDNELRAPSSLPHRESREKHLAFKYGYLWLSKTFPLRCTADDQGASSECPISRISLRNGSNDSKFHRLAPGSRLFDTFPCYVSEEALPPSMPHDLWFTPAKLANWSQDDSQDMLALSFRAPTRVFILLPSLTREPRWLRPLFVKMRDPRLREVSLKGHWRSNSLVRLILMVFGLLADMRAQTIKVYRSKEIWFPGQKLVLGGPGLAGLTDTMFVTAFREERPSSQGRSRGDVVPRSFVNGSLASYDAWISQLYRSIQKGRRHEVLLLIEAELSKPKSSSHLQNDISFVPTFLLSGRDDSVPKLFVDLAVSSHNLDILICLVHKGKCMLSYRALVYILSHFEECPPSYGGAVGVLSQYIAHHGIKEDGRPLSIVSAIMSALREEKRSRIERRKPWATIDMAVDKFEALQLELLAKLQVKLRFVSKGHQLEWLKATLDPEAGSDQQDGHQSSGNLLISDFKPLQVAFRDSDLSFFAHPAVQGFVGLWWQGSEFLCETQHNGSHSLSFVDPNFLFQVLCKMGFYSRDSEGWFSNASKLWHLQCFASSSFYRSPRSRWLLSLLSHIMFLVIYQQCITHQLIPDWWTWDGGVASPLRNSTRLTSKVNAAYALVAAAAANPSNLTLAQMAQDAISNTEADLSDYATSSYIGYFLSSRRQVLNFTLLILWLLGYMMETLYMLRASNSSIFRFLSERPLHSLFLIVDSILFALGIVYILALESIWLPTLTTAIRLTMLFLALAPFVWVRILFTIVPLVPKLGPMLWLVWISERLCLSPHNLLLSIAGHFTVCFKRLPSSSFLGLSSPLDSLLH
jgi:hypothetical protein